MIRRYGVTGLLVLVAFLATLWNEPGATIDVIGRGLGALGEFGGTVVSELSEGS